MESGLLSKRTAHTLNENELEEVCLSPQSLGGEPIDMFESVPEAAPHAVKKAGNLLGAWLQKRHMVTGCLIVIDESKLSRADGEGDSALVVSSSLSNLDVVARRGTIPTADCRDGGSRDD